VKQVLGSALVVAAMAVAGGAAVQNVNVSDAMQTAQNAAPPAPVPTPPPESLSPFVASPPVGKAAGTFMVRVIGVIPENWSSSISAIGGHVNVSSSAAPEVDLSYFPTDHIAVELIAASSRHDIKATGTALGTVDVGSTWVLPPTLTVQYHLMPHQQFSRLLAPA